MQRERRGWLPVLFFKTRARPEPPAPANGQTDDGIDAQSRSWLRMVAQMLPRCAPEGAEVREELQEIADRLEVLAGGLPDQEWADAVAGALTACRTEDGTASRIRVRWG